jgi:outer membrane protein assembly factor BamB
MVGFCRAWPRQLELGMQVFSTFFSSSFFPSPFVALSAVIPFPIYLMYFRVGWFRIPLCQYVDPDLLIFSAEFFFPFFFPFFFFFFFFSGCPPALAVRSAAGDWLQLGGPGPRSGSRAVGLWRTPPFRVSSQTNPNKASPAMDAAGNIYSCHSASGTRSFDYHGAVRWTHAASVGCDFAGPSIRADGVVIVGGSSGVCVEIAAGESLYFTPFFFFFFFCLFDSLLTYCNESVSESDIAYTSAPRPLLLMHVCFLYIIIIHFFFLRRRYALNADGTEAWAFTAGVGSVQSGICIDTDLAVAFASSTNYYVLNADGTQRWTKVSSGHGAAGCAIRGANVIVTGISAGVIRAWAMSNGATAWAPGTGSPAGFNNYLSTDATDAYHTTADDLHRTRLSDGFFHWTQPIPSGNVSALFFFHFFFQIYIHTCVLQLHLPPLSNLVHWSHPPWWSQGRQATRSRRTAKLMGLPLGTTSQTALSSHSPHSRRMPKRCTPAKSAAPHPRFLPLTTTPVCCVGRTRSPARRCTP